MAIQDVRGFAVDGFPAVCKQGVEACVKEFRHEGAELCTGSLVEGDRRAEVLGFHFLLPRPLWGFESLALVHLSLPGGRIEKRLLASHRLELSTLSFYPDHGTETAVACRRMLAV